MGDESHGLFCLKAGEMDTDGPWLTLASPPCAEGLERSLREHGQLEPLLVARLDASEQRWTLVHGARRLRLLADMNAPLMVREVQTKDELHCGLMRLACNRAYEWGEQALPHLLLAALRFFQVRMNRGELEKTLPPALGLSDKARVWRSLRQWGETFSSGSPWDEHLAAGRVQLQAVELLTRFDEAGRESLLPLFGECSWSMGGARQLLTLVWEASRAANASAEDILLAAAQKTPSGELLDPALSPKDAMARVLDALREVRYPARSALEREFAAAARELTAGTPWTLAPEQGFETASLTLSARLPSPDAAEQAAARLLEMARLPQWRKAASVGSSPKGGDDG